MGEIFGLLLQPRYILEVNGIHIAKYVADFWYADLLSNINVIEDVKGVRTREYIIKKKLMKAIHGIEIVEV